ncbi:MAG: NAD(P)H-binding protein [Mycobacterium sp.]
MSAPSDLYLIASATGKTGVHAVELLRERGLRVRALVHRHDERSQRLAELGAEVVEGDLLDFGAVSSVVAGVTAAYFCYPISPGALLEATSKFAQAASEAGVRSVVNMSQISARRDAKSHAAQ